MVGGDKLITLMADDYEDSSGVVKNMEVYGDIWIDMKFFWGGDYDRKSSQFLTF